LRGGYCFCAILLFFILIEPDRQHALLRYERLLLEHPYRKRPYAYGFRRVDQFEFRHEQPQLFKFQFHGKHAFFWNGQ